ncbi:Dfp1/Him1, central region-domain-containing protein [Xylogone sp. PMI_703]|nr:Dfp1/Him1, central region-domain-containing protein [Xylogone sp. PMI_703]
MAAASVSQLPHSTSSMSGRRVPLSSNPNAVNSPYRAVAAAAASKQKRSYAAIQREETFGQPPPAKKQMLESHQPLKTPPRQQSNQVIYESRHVPRKITVSQPSTFERKSVTVRERQAQQGYAKLDKVTEENLETIRQWQKHYRRIFPKFVFYFESIPEDVRLKCSRQVTMLGAREEMFFSNAVTHVVTTRAIPPERDMSAANIDVEAQNTQPQTINPSLLEQPSESVKQDSLSSKAPFTFDVSINRRSAPGRHERDGGRQPGRSSDVLLRARELGIKIWALEKLQRMMTTMFDTDTYSGYEQGHGHSTRGNSVQGTASVSRSTREADLSQLLRNERINGPSDRDPTVITKEMVYFKGPFIYIHDMDEKLKPIMVREYAKVQHKEDGDWPQFRSVSGGKCPFVEEADYEEREREKMRYQRQQEREKAAAPRTRPAASTTIDKMQPPKTMSGNRGTAGTGDSHSRSAATSTRDTGVMEEQISSRNHVESSRDRQNAFVSRAGAPRLFAGEPVASGMQPSNITSAIRSQMISSTAAQPGAKTGISKEVHGLQRKVLEKNSGGPASHGHTSSHHTPDVGTFLREGSASRTVRRKAQEKLDYIDEDVDPSEAEESVRRTEAARKAKAVQKKRSEKRDTKPGYCENCQDKFEDFEEHIASRRHRKFADTADNWRELDALLRHLERPLRIDY